MYCTARVVNTYIDSIVKLGVACHDDEVCLKRGGEGDAGRARQRWPERMASLPAAAMSSLLDRPISRGLHSSTLRLNVSAFCGIGSAFKGCLGGV